MPYKKYYTAQGCESNADTPQEACETTNKTPCQLFLVAYCLFPVAYSLLPVHLCLCLCLCSCLHCLLESQFCTIEHMMYNMFVVVYWGVVLEHRIGRARLFGPEKSRAALLPLITEPELPQHVQTDLEKTKIY